MAQDQKLAEKDLLKIIENPDEADKKKSFLAKMSGGKKLSLPPFGRMLKKPSADGKPFNVKELFTDRKALTNLLSMATVFVFIIFAVNFVQEYSLLRKAKSMESFKTTLDRIGPSSAGEGLGLSEEMGFLDQAGFSLRNIFQPKEEQPVEAEEQDTFSNRLQDYKLVGISVSPEQRNSYAMIENAKTNVTFFLKKGEQLDGMELVQIEENKLMLSIQGQLIELR